MLQLVGGAAVRFTFCQEAVRQIVDGLVILIVHFHMGGIVLQAVVVGFIHAYGVIGLVVDLRVAPLLGNPVMGISGLQARGTFVVPFIHAVGVQCMGFVEEQPLLVEG